MVVDKSSPNKRCYFRFTLDVQAMIDFEPNQVLYVVYDYKFMGNRLKSDAPSIVEVCIRNTFLTSVFIIDTLNNGYFPFSFLQSIRY